MVFVFGILLRGVMVKRVLVSLIACWLLAISTAVAEPLKIRNGGTGSDIGAGTFCGVDQIRLVGSDVTSIHKVTLSPKSAGVLLVTADNDSTNSLELPPVVSCTGKMYLFSVRSLSGGSATVAIKAAPGEIFDSGNNTIQVADNTVIATGSSLVAYVISDGTRWIGLDSRIAGTVLSFPITASLGGTGLAGSGNDDTKALFSDGAGGWALQAISTSNLTAPVTITGGNLTFATNSTGLVFPQGYTLLGSGANQVTGTGALKLAPTTNIVPLTITGSSGATEHLLDLNSFGGSGGNVGYVTPLGQLVMASTATIPGFSAFAGNDPYFSDCGIRFLTNGKGLTLNRGATLVDSGSNEATLNGTLKITTDLEVTEGGTGSSIASGARTNLGAAASGANSDILSLTGLTGASTITLSTDVTGLTLSGASPRTAPLISLSLPTAVNANTPFILCEETATATRFQVLRSGTVTMGSSAIYANGNASFPGTTSVGALSFSLNGEGVRLPRGYIFLDSGTNEATGTGDTILTGTLSAGATGFTVDADGDTVAKTLDLTGGQISVTDGGTGSSTASGARTNLGAAASGTNSDILQLTGLTTALSLAQGGTGQTSASDILGTADQVSVSGGTGKVIGGGNVTLSLPQSIATTSSPTFSELNVKHVVGTSSTPGIAANLTGIGANGTVAISGTDLAGTIQITTDAADTPGASSDLCTITFNVPYSGAPVVMIEPANDAAWNLVHGIVRIRNSDTTASVFKIRSGPTPLPALTGETYLFNYHSIK